MKKLTNSWNNPLICDKCQEYMYMEFWNPESNFIRAICTNCWEEKYSKTKEKIKYYSEKKFTPYNKLWFKYDNLDYFFIPWLKRPWNEWFLTPVFFNLDLLLHYNSHPDYNIKMYTFSCVSIYDKSWKELVNHSFWINRKGKLFCWLWDLYQSFEKHLEDENLKRLLLSNIESDHDIISTFYINQIEANFTESDNEEWIFYELNKLNDKILEKFNFKLVKIDILLLRSWYKHPILNLKDDIFSSYLKLCKALIENINVEDLKIFLTKNWYKQEDLKDKWSLKIFEVFIKTFYVWEIYKLMTPLYVLYDLRILEWHLYEKNTFDEKYLSCKNRLWSNQLINDLDFFKKLMWQLITFYQELNENI